jgi:hypothetical protein
VGCEVSIELIAERQRLALLRIARLSHSLLDVLAGDIRRIVADALLVSVAALGMDDAEALRLAAHLSDDHMRGPRRLTDPARPI